MLLIFNPDPVAFPKCVFQPGEIPEGGAKAWGTVVAVGGWSGGLVEEEAAGRALSKLQSITQRSIQLEPVLPRSSPAPSLRGELEGEASSRWSSPKTLLHFRDVMFMAWAAKRRGIATLVRQRPSASCQRQHDINGLSHNVFHAGNYVAINTLSPTRTLPLLPLQAEKRVVKTASIVTKISKIESTELKTLYMMKINKIEKSS